MHLIEKTNTNADILIKALISTFLGFIGKINKTNVEPGYKKIYILFYFIYIKMYTLGKKLNTI